MSFNKTNIGWCDTTWNPVTGCNHGCDYCYADKLTQHPRYEKCYPYGFNPTFYPKRLLKNPPGRSKRIFVGSMADLFGNWSWRQKLDDVAYDIIPGKHVIEKVLEYCAKHPDKTFQFLTKNPEGMHGFIFPENCWCGTTVTCNNDAKKALALKDVNCNITFVSFEPLFEVVDDFNLWRFIDWAIMGPISTDKSRVPNLEVFEEMRNIGRGFEIPLFIKNAAYKYHPKLQHIQKFPD